MVESIAHGGCVKHRVFFADEGAAVLAGKPLAPSVCRWNMPLGRLGQESAALTEHPPGPRDAALFAASQRHLPVVEAGCTVALIEPTARVPCHAPMKGSDGSREV